MPKSKFVYNKSRGCLVDVNTGEESNPIADPKPLDPHKRIWFAADVVRYDCPITGVPIVGKAEHEANLKRHGVRVIEKGEQKDAIRAKAYQEEAMWKKVDKTMDRLALEHDLSE